MTIFLKYLLKCLWQNKFRTSLILCAIIISSGMLFSSLSVSSSLVRIQMDTWRSTYGYSDILVQGNSFSPSPYFYMQEALQWMPSAEYIVGEISGFGILETLSGEEILCSVRGIDWDDLNEITPVPMVEDAGVLPFMGGKTILGKNVTDRYSINVGDILYLTINGIRHSLRLSGIASPKGFFAGGNYIVSAIVPKDRLASYLEVPGRVDRIYIKLKSPELKYRLITLLSVPYKYYTVKESFSKNEIKRQTDQIVTPIMIVTIILSFMSIYILYSAFKVIMLERLPVIGTFRSIGATIHSTRTILLLESMFYGVAGGFAGCGFGIFLLYIMSIVISRYDMKLRFFLPSFDPAYLLLSFAAAVLLSLAGAIAPAVRISRLPVKELVFHSPTARKNYRKILILFGFVLFCVSLSASSLVPAEMGKWVSISGILLFMISMVILIPVIAGVFSRVMGWFLRFLFQNEGLLALGQVRSNKNSLNNITLITIGVSSLFMVITLNDGEMRQIMDCYDRCHYDILVRFSQPNKNLKNILTDLPDIQDVLENQERSVVYLEGYEEPIYCVQGICIKDFENFHTLSVPQGQGEILNRLDDGRMILLSTILRDRWDLKEGDALRLLLRGSRGNTIYRNYTVLGFFDNLFPGRWSYALISEGNFRRDIASNSPGTFYVKSKDDTREAVNRLQSLFAHEKPFVQTVEELIQETLEVNQQVFSILKFFSVITALTGTFGILNNMLISFMERKRTLAILRSIGMSFSRMVKMLLAEGFVCGILGGLAGVSSGLLVMFNIIPYVIKAIGSETRIYYSVPVLITCFTGGFLVPLLASLGPVIRLGKINLVSTVQYE